MYYDVWLRSKIYVQKIRLSTKQKIMSFTHNLRKNIHVKTTDIYFFRERNILFYYFPKEDLVQDKIRNNKKKTLINYKNTIIKNKSTNIIKICYDDWFGFFGNSFYLCVACNDGV